MKAYTRVIKAGELVDRLNVAYNEAIKGEEIRFKFVKGFGLSISNKTAFLKRCLFL